MFNSVFVSWLHFVSCQNMRCVTVQRQPSPKRVNLFLEMHAVVGWLPWEADFEMEIGVQVLYWGVILETTLLRSEGSRIGQRKISNCNTVATETSADPTGCPGA